MIATKILTNWQGNFSAYGEDDIINEVQGYVRYEEVYSVVDGQVLVYIFKDGSSLYIKEVDHNFVEVGTCKNRKQLYRRLKKEIALYRVA